MSYLLTSLKEFVVELSIHSVGEHFEQRLGSLEEKYPETVEMAVTRRMLHKFRDGHIFIAE